jgi:C4-dicarboxylate transporter, DctM subunit
MIPFSTLMITTLDLGFITLPFGLNLLVMAGLTRTPIGAIARQAFSFVIAMVIVFAIIGFVPPVSIFTLAN